MVQDRITDGYRVAELLASEVDGRQTGPLGDLAVANADRSVSGSPDGERAYDVRRVESDRDPRREPTPDDAGTLVAEVYVHESGASATVVAGADAAVETARESGLGVDRDDEAGAPAIVAAYGAQTKRVADALAAASDELADADDASDALADANDAPTDADDANDPLADADDANDPLADADDG